MQETFFGKINLNLEKETVLTPRFRNTFIKNILFCLKHLKKVSLLMEKEPIFFTKINRLRKFLTG